MRRHTHTGSCVYRFGAVTRGCAVYLSFLPPLWVKSLAFSLSLIWLKRNCRASRWEGRKIKDYLQQCSNTCAEQAPVWAHGEADLTEAAWPWSLSKFCPFPLHSKTLSDGHLLNSLLLSEKKKKTFSSTTSTPFPPNPKETAGIGPRGAVLLGTLWERDETRGKQMRENEGGSI